MQISPSERGSAAPSVLTLATGGVEEPARPGAMFRKRNETTSVLCNSGHVFRHDTMSVGALVSATGGKVYIRVGTVDLACECRQLVVAHECRPFENAFTA